MNKKYFTLKLILAALLLCGVAAGCSGLGFNAAGVATVNIELDKAYEGVEVSCVNGEVDKVSDKGFKVELNSRNLTHILITAPGYETETIKLTTADLKDGTVNKAVTLSVKRILLTLTISRYTGDLNNVIITDSDNKEIAGVVEKNRIILELDDYDKELTVAAEGYYTNFLTVKETDFFNYKLSRAVPLLKGSGTPDQVLLTLYDDVSTGQGGYYGHDVYLTEYGKDPDMSYTHFNNGTWSTVLSKDKDYIITERSGSDNKSYIPISKGRMEELLGGEQPSPYLSFNLSEIITVSDDWHQGVSLKVILPDSYDYSDFEVVGKYYWSAEESDPVTGEYTIKDYYAIRDCNAGDSILIYNITDNPDDKIFYRYTITGQDIATRTITFLDKDDSEGMTSKLEIYKPDGEIDDGVIISLYHYLNDMNLEWLKDNDIVTSDSTNGKITFNTLRLIEHKWSNLYYGEQGYISIAELLANELTEICVGDTVKLTFKDIDGNIIDNESVNQYKDYSDIKPGYSFYIDIPEYRQITGSLIYDRIFFTDNDGVWERDVTLYKQAVIEVVTNPTVRIEDLNVYSNDFSVDVRPENGKFFIRVDESMIGKIIQFSYYSNDKNEHVYLFGQVKLEQQHFIDGKITVDLGSRY